MKKFFSILSLCVGAALAMGMEDSTKDTKNAVGQERECIHSFRICVPTPSESFISDMSPWFSEPHYGCISKPKEKEIHLHIGFNSYLVPNTEFGGPRIWLGRKPYGSSPREEDLVVTLESLEKFKNKEIFLAPYLLEESLGASLLEKMREFRLDVPDVRKKISFYDIDQAHYILKNFSSDLSEDVIYLAFLQLLRFSIFSTEKIFSDSTTILFSSDLLNRLSPIRKEEILQGRIFKNFRNYCSENNLPYLDLLKASLVKQEEE